MNTLFEIEANGKTYKRHAWTGGDTPDFNQSLPFTQTEYDELTEAFYLDQYKDYWANSRDPLPSDVHEIFLNRARLDAWRTLKG